MNKYVKYGLIVAGVGGAGFVAWRTLGVGKGNEHGTNEEGPIAKPDTAPVAKFLAGTRLQVAVNTRTNEFGGAKIRQTEDGSKWYKAKQKEYIGISTGQAKIIDGIKFAVVADKTDATVWVAEDNVEESTPEKERDWWDSVTDFFNW